MTCAENVLGSSMSFISKRSVKRVLFEFLELPFRLAYSLGSVRTGATTERLLELFRLAFQRLEPLLRRNKILSYGVEPSNLSRDPLLLKLYSPECELNVRTGGGHLFQCGTQAADLDQQLGKDPLGLLRLDALGRDGHNRADNDCTD
jgi:hypothetical protein